MLMLLQVTVSNREAQIPSRVLEPTNRCTWHQKHTATTKHKHLMTCLSYNSGIFFYLQLMQLNYTRMMNYQLFQQRKIQVDVS